MLEQLAWFRLLIAALATYRLAQFVSLDDGPFDVCKRWRKFLGQKAGYWQGVSKSTSFEMQERFVASYKFETWATLKKLFDCPFCTGVWFALFCLVLVMQNNVYADLFLLWFAIAGIQSYLQEASRGTFS